MNPKLLVVKFTFSVNSNQFHPYCGEKERIPQNMFLPPTKSVSYNSNTPLFMEKLGIKRTFLFFPNNSALINSLLFYRPDKMRYFYGKYRIEVRLVSSLTLTALNSNKESFSELINFAPAAMARLCQMDLFEKDAFCVIVLKFIHLTLHLL